MRQDRSSRNQSYLYVKVWHARRSAMNHWVFPATIVALLLNLVALLLTFLGVKSVSIVLGLAVLTNFIVVITLVLLSRTVLTKPASAGPTAITLPAAPDTEPPTINTLTGKGSEEISSPITSPDPVILATIEELLSTAPKSGRGSENGGAAVEQDQHGTSDKEELLDNSQWLGLVEECVEL